MPGLSAAAASLFMFSTPEATKAGQNYTPAFCLLMLVFIAKTVITPPVQNNICAICTPFFQNHHHFIPVLNEYG
jgi:hypothetical protein